MFRYFTALKQVLEKFLTMQRSKKDAQMLLKLLNFKNMKASLFYEILREGNVSLLIPNQKIKVSGDLLMNAWYNILDEYYTRTDPVRHRSFISELKRSGKMKNEMAAIEGAYTLYLFGYDGAEETLKRLGVSGNIDQRIKTKQTKYRLFVARTESRNKEVSTIDYYDLLAIATKRMGTSLNGDMLLVEWIGILNQIKSEKQRA